MNVYSLLRVAQTTLSSHRNLNCWTAAITRQHRKVYLNTYPTYLVFPDGSSISIDYHEPRRIIILPVKFETLSAAEQRKRLQQRRIVKKVQVVEEYVDDYDETEFYKMATSK